MAHRLIVIIYHMLKERVPYREIGTTPQSESAKRKVVERLERQIEQLGYTAEVNAIVKPALQPA